MASRISLIPAALLMLVGFAACGDDSSMPDAGADCSSEFPASDAQMMPDAPTGMDGAMTAHDANTENPSEQDAGARDAALIDDTMDADAGQDTRLDAELSDGGLASEAGEQTSELCEGCPPGERVCGKACLPEAVCCTEGGPRTCAGANAIEACISGSNACRIVQCVPGFRDCDNDPSNGCEVDLRNAATCGACNVACAPSEFCAPMGCVSACTPPLTQCGSRCLDLSNDPAFCGGCDAGCNQVGGGLPTCTGGQCGTTCAAGFTGCGASCADLQTSPDHCGTCDHPCTAPIDGQAACVAGTCVASCLPGWTISSGACVPPPLATPQWLVTGLTTPEDLAVDDTHVYWTDIGAGTVSSVPKDGGTITLLAQGQAKPLRIAVDATNVYWINNLGGAVMVAPKSGWGVPSVLASAVSPLGIAAVAGKVYWSNTGSGASYTLQVSPSSGGEAQAVYFAVGPPYPVAKELISDGTSIFLQASGPNGQQYYQLDPNTETGSALTLLGPTTSFFMAIGSDYAYFQDGVLRPELVATAKSNLQAEINIIRCGPLAMETDAPPCPSATTGAVDTCAMYYPADGSVRMLVHGTSTVVLRLNAGVNRIVYGGGYLYWTDTTGAIGRVPAH